MIKMLFTERELRLLELASWRLMNDAYKSATYSAQKRADISDEEALAKLKLFYKDAEDSKCLVGRLREALKEID